MWEFFYAFDNSVYDFVSGFRTDSMTNFMRFVTFCGSEWMISALTVLFPVLVFLFRKKRFYRLSLAATANIALGALFNEILKHLFLRERPDLMQLVKVSGYSFPSGHSMNSMIFYGFFIYIIIKNMKHRSRYFIAGALGLLVFMIGISRIYLGVHYASDVLAGFIIGLAWLMMFIRLTDRYVQYNKIY